MYIKDLVRKWKGLCLKMNQSGVPVPLVRDPKKGRGSVSLTLVFLSFNIWLISIIGKATNLLGGVDNSAALQMFMVTASLYWFRKLPAKGIPEDIEAESEDLKK